MKKGNNVYQKRVKTLYEEYLSYPLPKTEFYYHVKNKFSSFPFPETLDGFHDWNIIKLLMIAKEFILPAGCEPTENTRYLKKYHFDMLANSGLVLSKVVHKLIICAKENRNEFINIIEECFEIWPEFNMGREEIKLQLAKSDVLSKIKTKQYIHEQIRSTAADFFKSENHHVIFPKRFKDSNEKKSLQIDLIVWSEDGSICGIDVKTSENDFDTFIKKKLSSYSKYCNKLFIITNNPGVVRKAMLYANQIGILFLDEGSNIIKVLNPAPVRNVTPKMQSYVQKIFINQLSTILFSLNISKMNSPTKAFNLVLSAVNELKLAL